MIPIPIRDALYYPFHLCSEETLSQILRQFERVHFRDYMAIQLTPFFGTTAFGDRMGDSHPELVSAGRLRQGYNTSGPLDSAMQRAVDLDLADPIWRQLFHRVFTEERRFQRGLFEPSHGMVIGNQIVPGPAALLRLMEGFRAEEPYSVERVRRLSALKPVLEDGYHFEYGMALIKTAASGVWTRRIADDGRLAVVTDSPGHSALLQRSCDRAGSALANYLLLRDGTCRPVDAAGFCRGT